KWAALIHWIATKYAIVREWLFGWLPFHIPPEWHNHIVFVLIYLSVANLGVYQETGQAFVRTVLKELWKLRFVLLFAGIFIFLGGVVGLKADGKTWSYIFAKELPLFLLWFPLISVGIAMLLGATMAWRWLLVTVGIFIALVIVNEVYVK